jgi:outer membrane protein TolC
MLNASMAREATAPIPELEAVPATGEPPPPGEAARAAVDARPELSAGRAEIARAEAEQRVMGSMYLPMAMVRTGPAYTMTERFGWMLMIGVSIPLWRGRLNAGTAEAEAMADMARADVSAMERMIGGETARARERVVAVRERYVALRDRVVPKAKQAVEASLAGYVSGQLPLVSVVEAAQALWMAQGDVIMAEAELGIAWARLDRAVGGRGGAR